MAFITYIFIIFHPLSGKKVWFRAKIEKRKQLHAVFSIVDIIMSPASNHIGETMVYFDFT